MHFKNDLSLSCENSGYSNLLKYKKRLLTCKEFSKNIYHTLTVIYTYKEEILN
jgi:hypothetical protein